MINLEKIEREVLKLDIHARGHLAQILLSSFDKEYNIKDAKAYQQEINRRIDSIKSGSVVGIPSEDVLTEVENIYG